FCPISSIEVKHGSDPRVQKFPLPFLTHVYPRIYAGRVPSELGYCFLPDGLECSKFVLDSTVIPSNVDRRLLVEIKDTNPYLYDEKTDIDESVAGDHDDDRDDGSASEVSTVAPSTIRGGP